MERLTYLRVCTTIAGYEKDMKKYKELIDEVVKLKQRPEHFTSGGERSSFQERSLREVKKIDNSPIGRRVWAVGLAFNDLRCDRFKNGWDNKDIENLIEAVRLSCDNRKVNAFYGLQNMFALPCEERTFKRAKRLVLVSVADLLNL